MKRKVLLFAVIATFPFIFAGSLDPQYVILGWNDLGMHCSNQDFSKMTILPPYNNLKVQVIQKGSATSVPSVVTSDFSVTYEVPGNTYSVGKTNFWTYVNQLFGVSPALNIGLTGVGLSGTMDTTGNYFHVEGIPVTPYPDSDLVNQHPYQLALMKLMDVNNLLVAQTRNVIPVSHEINCVSSGCHSSEQSILNMHVSTPGFNPNGPNLCASCHASNALGTPGQTGVPNLSLAIHGFHAGETNTCYKCHPGPNTQCYRDVMFAAGITCQTCHGSVNQIAQSIQNGRQPWLQEPSCSSASCHDANHAPEPNTLYRQSKGHGGLFCSACHGSPHAVVPTNQPNDNLQNLTYQGYAGKLEQCTVCHGITPNMPGPHGYLPTDIRETSSPDPTTNGFTRLFPNPSASQGVHINFQVKDPGKYRIQVFDLTGRQVALLSDQNFRKGNYALELNTTSLGTGAYLVRMNGNNCSDVRKFILE